MRNGIKAFREKAGLSKAELARRIGTTRQQLGRLENSERKLTLPWAAKIAQILKCEPQDLIFPELAKIDTSRFNNVFEIAADSEIRSDTPGIAIDTEFLARMLPNASRHNLRFMMVDAYQSNSVVTKGDALVIDMDDNSPSRPGLYAVEIAGVVQWRYLSPTTAGLIQVRSESAADTSETVKATDLKVIGRARLRISTL